MENTIFTQKFVAMDQKQLIATLINEVNAAQKGVAARKEIYTNSTINGKNEFLFFIKPEITLPLPTIQLEKIFEVVLNKIQEFKFSIGNILILPAAYLKKHHIIAAHYGVINAISSNVRGNLSPGAKENFSTLFNINFETANIYGSLELTEEYPELSPTAIDYIWQNSPTVKLGGGAYAQSLKFDSKPIFLVNGFHPRQLEHFIADGRSILAFTLKGDTDWEIARNNFIGKTNPLEAAQGSIRRELLNGKAQFGLPTVSSSWNGVHLSAGPVEGLVELMRYNTDFNSKVRLSIHDFNFGKELLSAFSEDTINKIITNAAVEYNKTLTTVFDVTEEKNSTEALQILKEIF